MQHPAGAHPRRHREHGQARSWPRATPRSRPTSSCWATTRARTSPASRRGAGFPELNADRHVLNADPRPARGLSRGRRPRHGHPGRPELQLQDRGLPEDRAGHGALRPLLGRDRHARRRRPCTTSAAAPRSPSPPASASSAAATTGRSSSSSRWTWPSSTRRGTGWRESLKIAAMADAYEVNVAPHNFYGHLATMMNAHFCAVVPEPAHHGDRPRRGALARTTWSP